MNERLIHYFDHQQGLEKLTDLKIRHIDALYISMQNIYGIACYESQAQLASLWERAAYQLAYRVQNQLPGELDDLRWDMYLVLYVDEPQINYALKKRIESNQFFFRKIVLTQADLGRLPEKFPLGFTVIVPEQRVERLWFDDRHFLSQWRSCVKESTRERLDQAMFQQGVDSAESLIKALSLPELTEVLGVEN
ncbi:hypothetical protein RB620_21130 [Paenibacillus sp. LHD-117]|uniref:ABC-three component system middle component 1 n=1 Tax=Paenibacillus sp. LHD-117 TaxID=3071412 RepID=UPI0027DF737E|nr:ABC-three component system middle component 1 [Paenibacillus sp. LHD-117]MDQ6421936.1 hypothetical protein [Paenibacillus sp. LHD-117]